MSSHQDAVKNIVDSGLNLGTSKIPNNFNSRSARLEFLHDSKKWFIEVLKVSGAGSVRLALVKLLMPKTGCVFFMMSKLAYIELTQVYPKKGMGNHEMFEKYQFTFLLSQIRGHKKFRVALKTNPSEAFDVYVPEKYFK